MRSRPLADAPAVPGVVLAKAWLVALVEAAPLAEAASIPISELATDGPAVCEALLAALASDAALDALVAAGPRVASFAGAAGGPGAVRAAESLRACAWRELRAAVPEADAALLADLGDRLAHVCSLIAAAAVGAGSGSLAVLMVEVDDHERLLAAAGDSGGATVLEAAATAVAGAAGPHARLVREAAGRFRAVTTAERAESLAADIAQGVARAGAPHGVPLRAAVGVAVAPEDGIDEAALVAVADERLFAARAAGVGIE